MGVGILRLLRRGIPAGSDGPDGFVGDDDIVHLGCGDTCEAATELCFQDFLLTTCIALFQGLADAEDGAQAAGQRGEDFFVNEGIGLPENLAAFAVAENHIAHKKLAQHGGADFSGEGTGHLEIHVLRAEADFLRAAEEFGKLRNSGEGRSYDDFHTVDLIHMAAEILKVADGLSYGHVHLPVGGDNFFAHVF